MYIVVYQSLTYKGESMKLSNVFKSLILIISATIFSTSVMAEESASGEVNGKCGAAPQQPNIPNGMKAKMDEMLAAQKNIKAYQAESQKYRACIDELLANWDNQSPADDEDAKKEMAQKKEIAVAFYNRSVSDEEDVANLFNTAIRAFKGKK